MNVSVKHLPLLIASLLGFTISFTLISSYKANHISGIFPYISDTGTLPPESCIFGQIMNVLWILMSLAVYAKYRQTKDILIKHNISEKEQLNNRIFYIGLAAAFGVSIVGNFQETNLLIVHWTGAILAFGLGSIYQCGQTVLYFTLVPIIGQRKRTRLRMALAATSMLTFSICLPCAMLSYAYKIEKGGYLHWKRDDGGYEYHVVSVITEWICATCIINYLLMFYWEFKKIKFHEPDIDVI